jgi:hypothetical protein
MTVTNRTHRIKSKDILLFSTVRNEEIRLPFFLDYYRNLGVNHFLIVDNNSSDGTVDYLSAAADISAWQTGWMQARYGRLAQYYLICIPKVCWPIKPTVRVRTR